MRILLFTLLIVGVTVVRAVCGELFPAMDQDGDGRVSWEDFQAARPNMKRAAFDAIDTNGDGSIRIEEWEAFRAAHGSRQGMPGQVPHRPMPNADGPDLPRIRPPDAPQSK